MNIEKETYRLSQIKAIEDFEKPLKSTDMLTVYLSDYEKSTCNYGIFPVLVPIAKKDLVLSSLSWNFSYEHGVPSSTIYYENGEGCPVYERFGNEHGFEPLIITRDFYGVRESYKEISEEFRHFHNLYHNEKSNEYYKFEDDGSESKVVVVEPNMIRIRVKEIRQFLAIKEMYLMLQFDHREHSIYSLGQLGIYKKSTETKKELSVIGVAYGEMGLGDINGFSRLLGKVLVTPLPKSKSGMYGFSVEPNEKECLDFIIDTDDAGDEIFHNSNPSGLANNFGANPDAPHYLTPVYFNKQVLDRYYAQPSKYSVQDSYIGCGSLWGVQIDNHHDDKVCVWLGDLGRDLPHSHQLHWKSYNVAPSGNVSEIYFKRQIMAQFTDPELPEHLFKAKYNELSELCNNKLGWQLMIPLNQSDTHHFECIRVPSTNEQKDFDELVLGLTKILVDSINEKRINGLIGKEERAELKGSISRLDKALQNLGFEAHAENIEFLRKLQTLRSTSSAHRKGSNYKKIASEFNIDNKDLRNVFTGILQKCLKLFDYLIEAVNSGQLGKS